MKIKSLNQRFMLFLVLPVALLLFSTGFLGFFYARGIMLDQWKKSAVMRLKWAAHHMDMRLAKPVELIEMFHDVVSENPHRVLKSWILGQIQDQEGVISVDLQIPQQNAMLGSKSGQGGRRGGRPVMAPHGRRLYTVSAPRFDTTIGKKAVDIVSEFRDTEGTLRGKLMVSVAFDYIMQDVRNLGWWESELACLVDESGLYLAQTKELKGRQRLGEANDPLELAILSALKTKEYGTYMGEGHPPKMVAGFHKLRKAPWAIVMFAPGEKILEPIVRFRNYYLVAMAFSILVILVLIKVVTGKAVSTIREISKAAEKIAQGEYLESLEVKTSDEIGRLAHSFNRMVQGLKERDFIRDTFGRYVDPEIAKELMNRPGAGRLGGEKREVAILMSDIRGFSTIAEKLPPELVITALNKHFGLMIDIVQEYKGIIVDFFGDGILVFFDPLDRPVRDYALNAVNCGIRMLESVEELSQEMENEGLPSFKIGIGVNVGEVVVGNIGSNTRAKYGIVGAPVNMVHRIQSEAKGGELVISEVVYALVNTEVEVTRSFTTKMKGMAQLHKLYAVKIKEQKKEA